MVKNEESFLFWFWFFKNPLSNSEFLDFLDQLFSRGNFTTTLTLRWFRDFNHLLSGCYVNTQVLGGHFCQRLLFGLHNVGQCGITGRVQAQVGGHYGWQFKFNGLEATVDLSLACSLFCSSVYFKFRSKCGLNKI